MQRLSAVQGRLFSMLPRWAQKAAMAYLALWVHLAQLIQARPIMGTAAFVSLGPVLSIVGLILGVILAVLVLSALAPVFFPAVKNLTTAFSGADTGSTLANTILGIIAIIIPLALVFGFALLVFRVSDKMKGGKGA